ncbi:parathyroid hormone 1a [Silurus meridionalis]|nr:parathyroid hormone 1a [Silurus meridionalis]
MSMRTDCRPLSRRSVSEVQLMHSVGLHKHIQQRQDWLQEHMQDIHTAPLHDGRIGDERITRWHSLSQAVRTNTANLDVMETQ